MTAVKKTNDQTSLEQYIDMNLRDGIDWDRLVVLSEEDPSSILGMALSGNIRHICQSSHPFFTENLNTAALLMKNESAFKNYPVSSILKPSVVGEVAERSLLFYEVEFQESNQKHDILADIESLISARGVIKSVAADALNIADELFTNAIYNAPFVDKDNNPSDVSRGEANVKLSGGKKARLFMGADERRLVMGCSDQYGSLNLLKLFERIKNCYDHGVAENMNMHGGGAGIGSFLVYNSAMSYFALTETGSFTQICCTLPIKISGRARSEMQKNLHFIIK